MPDIEINGIRKTFKNQTVLDNISFECKSGSIYGLVGHNGSGKSVLMKIICGLLYPDNGYVRIDGKQIGKDTDFPPNTGVIIEQPNFIPYISGYKNLKYLADINKKVGREEIREVMKNIGLDPDSKKWVARYSLGMKQRLAIAQAIMEEPDLLILDEPMNSLDEKGIEDVRRYLLEIKKKGKTIILASHYKEDISVLCDRIIKLENGKIVSDELREDVTV